MENKKSSNCSMCERSTYRLEEDKKNITRRLNIIEGQVRGIKQMIEEDRYCDDVLIQLSAVNKAVESLENTILENHFRTCVNRELKAGNDGIINEVMELFKRLR